jgi:hypothetical protein
MNVYLVPEFTGRFVYCVVGFSTISFPIASALHPKRGGDSDGKREGAIILVTLIMAANAGEPADSDKYLGPVSGSAAGPGGLRVGAVWLCQFFGR